MQTGALRHDLRVGVAASRLRYRFGPQVNQFVGTGNDSGTAITPANPTPNDENTNRTERSTELFVNDAVRLGPRRHHLAGPAPHAPAPRQHPHRRQPTHRL